jgi:hypothetical protein
LAEALLKLGDPGAAAEAVHQLADALPDSAEGHRRAAELLAQCITVAQMLKSADVDTDQLARQALGYLQRARAGGAIDAESLRQGDVWKPLRQHDDFSIILAPPKP